MEQQIGTEGEKTIETTTQEPQQSNKENPPPKEIPKIPFKCEECTFQIVCNYKGLKPPFAKNIQFQEDCYVMQDPFSPPPGNLSAKSNSEYFIVIGVDCSACGRTVCSSPNCSIFYRKSYCAHCAYQSVNQFPVEIQSKIRKCFRPKT